MRRALRLRHRVLLRTAGRHRHARAAVSEEEAEAAVVRGRRAPGRGLRGRRAARSRARPAHRQRDRGDARVGRRAGTAGMTPRLDLIGLVVRDLAASLAFYRRLGLEIPAGAETEAHVEATLRGGLRLAWDTVDVMQSFDPNWTPAA